MRALSLLEGRVLGVLVEKAHTVPDSYPLSLNSLALGCSQKTAREPVMNVTEGDARSAIDSLKALHLVLEASGSRVTRYEHNMGRAMQLPSQSVALLVTLMLRGPQTLSELRTASERLHRFADLSSVEGFLVELSERSEEKGGPLVVKLARTPGARESRWAHLLCGPVDATLLRSACGAEGAEVDDFVAVSELAAFKARQAEMGQEITALRALVDRLYRELGIARE